MAVVKANAYGHGIEAVVRTLTHGRPQIDGFAVATVSEALRVRSETESHPVLLLEGILHADDIVAADELGLWIAIHSDWQIDLLEQARPARPLKVWLKVDTGMHRLGFRPEFAEAAVRRLRSCRAVHEDVVLMSHLANADDTEDQKTALQLERTLTLKARLGLRTCSLANSAGAVGWDGAGLDWTRAGLALYGASPILGQSAADLALEPAMTLESTLIAINQCRAHDAIGYGGAWRCPDDMPVGVVGIGYGDGYPRHAGNGTPVDIGGNLCPIVGRVSMDMLCVDLRPAAGARIGDTVQLWGDRVPVETIAHAAETIPYELLCGVTPRVPVVYRG